MKGKMLIWICPNCQFKVPMKETEFPIRCRCGFFGVIEESIYIDPKDWPKKPPSIPQLGVNFIKATANDIRFKGKRINEEDYNKRLDICNDCDFCIHRPVKQSDGTHELMVHRCSHKGCGCFLKLKAWRKSEECPEGYWPRIEDKDGKD